MDILSHTMSGVAAASLGMSFTDYSPKQKVNFLALGALQIITRPVDFNYSGHTTRYDEFEKASLEIQKEILGEDLYEVMLFIDSKIPLNF